MKTSQYRFICGMLFLILAGVGSSATQLSLWIGLVNIALGCIYFAGSALAARKE